MEYLNQMRQHTNTLQECMTMIVSITSRSNTLKQWIVLPSIFCPPLHFPPTYTHHIVV